MKRIFLLSVLLIYTTVVSIGQVKDHQANNSSANPFRFSFQLPFKHSGHYLHIEKNGGLRGFRNSLLLFESNAKNNRLNGIWKSWHSNGSLLDSGNLEKGIPDGVWKVWNENGILVSVRTYNADLFRRIKNDIELNHPRFSYFPITEHYKKEGTDVLNNFSPNYSFSNAARFSELTLEEAVVHNQNNFSSYHPVFLECLHNGLYLNYYDNGTLKDSGYYKNGLKEGVWIHQTQSRKSVWKGAYKNSIRHSEWKEYDEKGKLKTLVLYNNKGEETMKKQMNK